MIDQATQRPGDDYRRAENFNRGDIRRLLTLATPHKGSKIANLLVYLHEHFPHIHGLGESLRETEIALLDGLRSTSSDLHNGAICDLAESSTAVEFSAVPEVYGIAHAGIAGNTDKFTSPISSATGVFHRDVSSPYLLTTQNDGVVELASAEGNLSRLQPDTVVEHDRLHSDEFKLAAPDEHPPIVTRLGIATSIDIARQVRDALDTPQGWEPLPAIQRESGQIGVPVSGGRGEIDNVSWLNQCAPGGPLNRMGN